jgi:GTP-binding protein
MDIKSAVFKKGSVTAVDAFADGVPHVAFIGRSNVGKSSTINALTKVKGLAKTSSVPGRTREINLFLVNNNFYIADLPGYGFAAGSITKRDELHALIEEYLFNPLYTPKKVVLIIDGKVGPTADDLAMLESMEQHGKDIIIAVNKIDRLKTTEATLQLAKIQSLVGAHVLIPYSAEKKTGIGALLAEIVK